MTWGIGRIQVRLYNYTGSISIEPEAFDWAHVTATAIKL